MSALDKIPTNLNFLAQNNYKFVLKRTPNTIWFLTKVNIPGIAVPSCPQPTPFINLTETGDHGEFKPLRVTFRVDENMQNYLEIHSWMRNIAKMDDFEEYKSLSQYPDYTGLGLKSEIILTILDSSRNPNMSFVFHGTFPIDLSDLEFSVDVSDIEYIVATVVFDYDNFDYTRVI